MIIIGSARHDEYGKYANGRAGDQDGTEVSTQNFYLHSKGWYVIRPNSLEKAQKIAYAMNAACNNNHIGYDQNQRNSLYSASKAVSYDPARVNVDTETDCSALVRVCCLYAGINARDFTTANECDVLDATGEFQIFAYSDGTDLYAGDILVTKTKGHTVVVTSSDKIRQIYPIGWNQDAESKKWWYQYGPKDNEYYSNRVVRINGKYYAFGKDGYMKEGTATIYLDRNGEIASVE